MKKISIILLLFTVFIMSGCTDKDARPAESMTLASDEKLYVTSSDIVEIPVTTPEIIERHIDSEIIEASDVIDES